MKKTIFVLITAILLVVGCSNYDVEFKQKTTKASSSSNNHSFEEYTHKDENGCEYIVIYEERGFGSSYAGGIGLGVAPKVNQPNKCSQNN